MFFSNGSLNAAYPVVVTVIYYGQGIGKRALRYDAVGNPEKTSLIVVKLLLYFAFFVSE